MSKKKLLLFHPALAPYRIDQFNDIGEMYELEVVFIFDNVWNHKFDQAKLLKQLQVKHSFLLKGPACKGRVFRFGMLKTIRRFNPDFILGYEYSFTTQYLILLKKLGLIHQKIGSTIDDSIEICNHVQSKIRGFARKYTVTQLDLLVVLTNEVSAYYQNTFGLSEKQIIISPILQKPERLRQESKELELIAQRYQLLYKLNNKKVLLFVGRFIGEKGLVKFIENTEALFQQDENLVFLLVGHGAEHIRIKDVINRSHLESRILLTGRYEGLELYAWYLCASGFVLPSTYEPFGTVVNEALIFGLPVLCSKYAGASSLINNYCGFLFDPLNKKETLHKLNLFKIGRAHV